MNISQTDICNRVLSEANGIPESGFPLDCFPAKVQSIILDMVSHENYKVEYIATSMLSAVKCTEPALHLIVHCIKL